MKTTINQSLWKCAGRFEERCRRKFNNLSQEKENLVDGSFVDEFLREASLPADQLWGQLCFLCHHGLAYERAFAEAFRKGQTIPPGRSMAGDMYFYVLENVLDRQRAKQICESTEVVKLPSKYGGFESANRRVLEWMEAGLVIGPLEFYHHYKPTADANQASAMISAAVVAARLELQNPKMNREHSRTFHQELYNGITKATDEKFPDMHKADWTAKATENIRFENPIVEMWLFRLWPFFTKNKWSTVEIRDGWLMKYLPAEAVRFRNNSEEGGAPGEKYFGQCIRRMGLRTGIRGGRKAGPRENLPSADFLTLFDFKKEHPGLNPLLYLLRNAAI